MPRPNVPRATAMSGEQVLVPAPASASASKRAAAPTVGAVQVGSGGLTGRAGLVLVCFWVVLGGLVSCFFYCLLDRCTGVVGREPRNPEASTSKNGLSFVACEGTTCGVGNSGVGVGSCGGDIDDGFGGGSMVVVMGLVG